MISTRTPPPPPSWKLQRNLNDSDWQRLAATRLPGSTRTTRSHRCPSRLRVAGREPGTLDGTRRVNLKSGRHGRRGRGEALRDSEARAERREPRENTRRVLNLNLNNGGETRSSREEGPGGHREAGPSRSHHYRLFTGVKWVHFMLTKCTRQRLGSTARAGVRVTPTDRKPGAHTRIGICNLKLPVNQQAARAAPPLARRALSPSPPPPAPPPGTPSPPGKPTQQTRSEEATRARKASAAARQVGADAAAAGPTQPPPGRRSRRRAVAAAAGDVAAAAGLSQPAEPGRAPQRWAGSRAALRVRTTC
jgi:hypothetical protein